MVFSDSYRQAYELAHFISKNNQILNKRITNTKYRGMREKFLMDVYRKSNDLTKAIMDAITQQSRAAADARDNLIELTAFSLQRLELDPNDVTAKRIIETADPEILQFAKDYRITLTRKLASSTAPLP